MAIDHLVYNQTQWVKSWEGVDAHIPFNTNLYVKNDRDFHLLQKFSGKEGTYRISERITFYKINYKNQAFYVLESDLDQNGGY